ncbi:AEC family transporter [Nesterenkonia sphaerica]|uniref:AEC family transporter n=1 Tax=Nesterenkonia sphaerica TaxID=1804988 RepID=A0A5R9A4N1_9MICC|nr:AEC family transporter [Nesterenkonia sphaerica]TLP72877.1 AEC family transporter [Nesterenkonia sphaerica]
MASVLSGFTVIWVIIVTGYLIGRFHLIPYEARTSLSRVAFFIATPCLLFVTISQAEFREVVGPQMAIAAISAVTTLALFSVLSVVLFRQRTGAERLLGGMSASLVNATNLGLPIAAYVLGDLALAAPVIVFQLALYTPLYVIALDQLTRSRGSSGRSSPQNESQTSPSAMAAVLRSVGQSAGNPMVLGALLGLLFSWQQWRLPGPLQESVEVIGGAAVPLMLLAFGLSLVGTKPLARASGRRAEVLTACVFKLVLHPTLAYLCATLIFGLQGHQLLTAVVLGGLPAAQNVFISAIRYGTGEIVARDTVLLTTLLAIPSITLFVAITAQ